LYIFPFSSYPYPVILGNDALHQVAKQPTSGNIFNDALPYSFEHVERNQFLGCAAILSILLEDIILGPNIGGAASLNRRLLEHLGFSVILLDHKDCHDFILPDHAVNVNSESYQKSVQSALAIIQKHLLAQE